MKRITTAIVALYFGNIMYAQNVGGASTDHDIDEVQLFGKVKDQPEGLEIITRLPLAPREQIQSISVISYKVIEDLGSLSLTGVVKNIPGVIQFASYGGTRESMSVRGYRGVPVLKNGVMMDSDFRTGAMLTDMQGVESIQVLKGSAAVTQGIGDGLGSAGGVINIVTKRPRFINSGRVGFRYGSWDMYRGTFDVERVLDAKGKVAVRLDGAYQNSNSFRKYVNTDRIYFNPSVAFKPDDKTKIVFEMDYMHDNTTPDRGTVNLGPGDVDALYKMPKGKFLGFKTDNNRVETFNYSTTVERGLTDNLKLRAVYIGSSYTSDNVSAGIAPATKVPNELRNRTLAKSEREDHNKVFQFDFIGKDLQTGFFTHTFQVGMDWKESDVITTSYQAKDVDVINVLETIPNTLPAGIDRKSFNQTGEVHTTTPTFGVMAQDVVGIGKYLKAHMGLRYSKVNGLGEGMENSTWNPSLGLMIFPIENLNIFGSYTTTTALRGANNPLQEGGKVGASKTKQWEFGIKSDWLQEKLRFNLTFFDINNDNLSYSVLDEQGNNTGFYGLAGNLRRKGLEVELIGRILPELQVMSGYSYLDAQYHNSPAYVEGSAPINAAKNTANAWVNYKFPQGMLSGLDLGLGAYFTGKRPVDDYTQKTFMGGHVNSVQPGVKPFLMDSYTTVDAQVGYAFNTNLSLRVFFNNIFDAIGYSSYFRGGFLDQIQPRNVSVQLYYKF